MLKKIYAELLAIRKELQAIRLSKEPNKELYIKVREPYDRNYKFVKLNSSLKNERNKREA